MIHYLKHNQIDFEKYDACIDTAINSRIYAYSWYLDIVADNWDVLVLNDYEAVMPLPWRQKYFIKYVYPPVWTQQLGVFSSAEVNAVLVEQFVNSIPKKFKKITIQFNSGNDVSLLKTEVRMNYILKLDRPYDEIYKGFNTNRKRVLKKGIKDCKISNEFCLEELILIAKEHYSILSYTKIDYNNLKKLLSQLIKSNNLILYGVLNIKNELIGGIIFFKSNYRITYLFSIMAPIAKKNNISSEIINLVIKEFSSTEYNIDFEGSMNVGISNFFKSFGSTPEVYRQFIKFSWI